MAGTLKVDAINASTGVLATQNGMNGICKAWVNFNGYSGSVSIRGSFNVSSVTRVSAGVFTVSYTTAMPNANYATAVTGSSQPGYVNDATSAACVNTYAPPSTTNVTVMTTLGMNSPGSDLASTYTNVIVLGS